MYSTVTQRFPLTSVLASFEARPDNATHFGPDLLLRVGKLGKPPKVKILTSPGLFSDHKELYYRK